MAEIKIKKKKPIWPWLVLVFIILAILYFLIFSDDDHDAIEDQDDMEQIEEEAVWDDQDTTSWEEFSDTTAWDVKTDTLDFYKSGLQAYFSHLSDSTKLGVDAEYTHQTMLKLVEAVEAKAEELNIDTRADIQLIRKDIEAIEENLSSAGHLSQLKNIDMKLTDILQKIQQQDFPQLREEISRMRSAISALQTDVQTIQQQEHLKKFFKEAAMVLNAMKTS